MPVRRQQVDEQLLASLEVADRERAAEAETQVLAVGIDPRHRHIIGQGRADIGEIHGDGVGELDCQHTVVGTDLVGGQIQPIREVDDDPGKTLLAGREQFGAIVGERLVYGKRQQQEARPQQPEDPPGSHYCRNTLFRHRFRT